MIVIVVSIIFFSILGFLLRFLHPVSLTLLYTAHDCVCLRAIAQSFCILFNFVETILHTYVIDFIDYEFNLYVGICLFTSIYTKQLSLVLLRFHEVVEAPS